MNSTVAGFMIFKSAAVDLGYTFLLEGDEDEDWWNESASPVLDAVGNLIWQIPVFGAIVDSSNHNAAGGLGFVGNTCFDANGVMSPFIAAAAKAAKAAKAAPGPETLLPLAILVGVAAALNFIYGLTTLAASIIQVV